MALPLYQVDAFTGRPFAGNPAAVVPFDHWLNVSLMQSIGTENNLSEMAFFVHSTSDEADFDIRWFTPAAEANLCGHATLASAFVLFNQLGWDRDEIRFASASGALAARRESSGMITLDFPVRESLRIPSGGDESGCFGE